MSIFINTPADTFLYETNGSKESLSHVLRCIWRDLFVDHQERLNNVSLFSYQLTHKIGKAIINGNMGDREKKVYITSVRHSNHVNVVIRWEGAGENVNDNNLILYHKHTLSKSKPEKHQIRLNFFLQIDSNQTRFQQILKFDQ